MQISRVMHCSKYGPSLSPVKNKQTNKQKKNRLTQVSFTPDNISSDLKFC